MAGAEDMLRIKKEGDESVVRARKVLQHVYADVSSLTIENTAKITMRNSEDLEIDVAKAAERLDRAVFLDVREPQETTICRIEGSRHVPMGRVPDALAHLPQDRPLVVYCHHGMRSLHVVHFLRAKGLENAVSLRGGIDRWSLEIDPEVPRY